MHELRDQGLHLQVSRPDLCPGLAQRASARDWAQAGLYVLFYYYCELMRPDSGLMAPCADTTPRSL